MIEWVNINDKRPDVGEVDGLELLVTIKEGTETRDGIWSRAVLPVIYYEREKWYPYFVTLCDDSELISEVEAWAYYPEPYKGGKQ